MFGAAVLCGCGRREETPLVLPSAVAPVQDGLAYLEPVPIGDPPIEHPWITHVNARDLDQDGRIDILACDAQTDRVVWLRQVAAGSYEETVIASEMRAPVHTETADMDGDGDLDVLVASMGQVFPNNDPIGSVIILENDGRESFRPHVVLQNVPRVNDVQAADLNGDGTLDLAVAQFGYVEGQVRWMERTGPWQFRSHILIDLAGAINVCIDDVNGDGTLDIVTLVSQQWEEIHVFAGDGKGGFTRRIIYGSTNQDYGSSGISLCDVNGDGRPDVLFTNGDGFDYARPGPRPWHGVQWLENTGGGSFRYHRLGDLPGAYGPMGVDLDSDGDMDIVAVATFADWENPGAVSLMMYENDGSARFTPRILARAPTHLLTLAVTEFGGAPALVTGGFYAFPPFDRMSRITLWRRR